jgi:hypothetical protein
MTSLTFRDDNNFFSDEEKLHPPLLPPPSTFGRDRFDNFNNNNNYDFNRYNDNDNDNGDADGGEKPRSKPYVPKFLLESRHCTDYRCMAHDLQRDPRQLAKFICHTVQIQLIRGPMI